MTILRRSLAGCWPSSDRYFINPESRRHRFYSVELAQTTSCPAQRHGVFSKTLDIRARLGIRVRGLRRERKWTQMGMADRFGIDRAFISDVERGRKSVSLRTLEVIALGMQLSISDLLEGI